MPSPAFSELWDKASESVEENGYKATMGFKCTWANRNAVLGYWLGNGGLLYPRNEASGARARSGTAVPLGAQSSNVLLDGGPGCIGVWDHALVTINFAYDNVTPDQGQGGELISETLEPTAEFVSTDPIGLAWYDGTALTKDEAPGKLIRGINYTYTRHFVTALPEPALTFFGSSNASSITAVLLGLTFGAETLLYSPPQCQRKWDQTMQTAGWSVTYRFSYKYPGWNWQWRGKTATWEQIRIRGSGVPSSWTIYKQYPPAAWTF